MQNQTGNFKVDTRDIPTLPKKGNIADAFLKWDHSFCSKMQLAKIGELLNKSYKTPDKAKEPNAYQVHETKDNYLQIVPNHGHDRHERVPIHNGHEPHRTQCLLRLEDSFPR